MKFYSDKGKYNYQGPTMDLSKFPPGFMLQMEFYFFKVENICVSTSNFVEISPLASYHLGVSNNKQEDTSGHLKVSCYYLKKQRKEIGIS